MLSKKYKLEAKNFRKTYQKGKKFRGEYGMLVIDNSNTSTPSKWGFVVSKKCGNAVHRNRMTRVLRAVAYDLNKELDLENKGLLLEYVAFKFCDDFNKLKEEISNHLG
jgi:ribonuclease P protein component